MNLNLNVLKKYFGKDLITLKFLNLNKIKWAFIIIASLSIVIYKPIIIQYILNTLFLITSFIVFLIIYAIIKIIYDLTKNIK